MSLQLLFRSLPVSLFLLRCASWLVPGRERVEWLAEWRKVMLIRGPAEATLGTRCSQSRWQRPPVTNRSPRPSSNGIE